MNVVRPTLPRPRRRRSPRGLALLLVMLALAMAGTFTITLLARQEATTGIGHNLTHHTRARALAETGIDIARRYVKNNPDWRSQHTHGRYTAYTDFAGGRFKVKFEDTVDNDPALDDNPGQPVRITALAETRGVSDKITVVQHPSEQASPWDLVMVVRRDQLPDMWDRLRKRLVESWGFNVTLLDDDASADEYDQAAASAGVIYVSERVWSSQVAGKLRDLPVGIVSEERAINDSLGLSDTDGASTYDSMVRITDNGHYITEPFDEEPQRIVYGWQTMRRHRGSIADGAEILARTLGGGPPRRRPPMLAIFERGATTHHGPAAERRVFLPWGDNAFNVYWLTQTGKTMLKRSLRWAAHNE
jgi:hypothetical protein